MAKHSLRDWTTYNVSGLVSLNFLHNIFDISRKTYCKDSKMAEFRAIITVGASENILPPNHLSRGPNLNMGSLAVSLGSTLMKFTSIQCNESSI